MRYDHYADLARAAQLGTMLVEIASYGKLSPDEFEPAWHPVWVVLDVLAGLGYVEKQRDGSFVITDAGKQRAEAVEPLVHDWITEGGMMAARDWTDEQRCLFMDRPYLAPEPTSFEDLPVAYAVG